MRIQKDIVGKEILNDEGNIIGKVKDVEIDNSSKRIIFLIASKEAEKSGFSLKMGKSDSEEKIPIDEVGSIGDKVILKKTLTDIINDL